MSSTYFSNGDDSDHEHWADDSDDPRTHTYIPRTKSNDSLPRLSPPHGSPVLSAISTAAPTAEPEEQKLTQLPVQYGYSTYPVVYAYPTYYTTMPAATPAPAPEPAKPEKSEKSEKSTKAASTKAPKSTVSGKTFTYHPRTSAPKKKKTHHWSGRTKEEVDLDNERIALAEKAHDKRKVEPINVAGDQVFWVKETDDSHTLRTFAGIEDLKGEWKIDHRYKDAYYFVIEKEGKED